jgi:hypothetical protein
LKQQWRNGAERLSFLFWWPALLAFQLLSF